MLNRPCTSYIIDSCHKPGRQTLAGVSTSGGRLVEVLWKLVRERPSKILKLKFCLVLLCGWNENAGPCCQDLKSSTCILEALPLPASDCWPFGQGGCVPPAGGAILWGSIGWTGRTGEQPAQLVFSVLEFKLWKINILQYTLALQYCVHTLSISRRRETYFLTY